jgi:ubiquinone/menaquinone biosynthesis C-methylase UbiE
MIVMTTDVEKFVRFCDSEYGKEIVKREAEYIYKELRNCEKILDVGCGIGQFEQKLPHLNIKGLDISKEMLQEARKRSDKTFVQGNAEHLKFKNCIFDAVFTVTTLEFLDDYKKALKEIARVTKHHGKILAMMLNPKSEYFREESKKRGDYFRRIKNINLKEIRDNISRFYTIIKEENILGIKDKKVFNSANERYTSLYVVIGIKKLSPAYSNALFILSVIFLSIIFSCPIFSRIRKRIAVRLAFFSFVSPIAYLKASKYNQNRLFLPVFS